MKKYFRLLVIFLAFSCWVPHIASAQVVNVPDLNLAAALRETLGLAPNAPITRQDMQRLIGFEAINLQIRDLTGLEHATRLRELNLNSNRITDLSLLAKLGSLTHLLLQVNEISDVSPLARLINLEYLALDYNAISNISALNRLAKNTHISWSNNPGFPIGGPKITGPWLWVLVPGKRLDNSTDFLARASGRTVTEQEIATNGAKEGTAVGNRVWTPGIMPC